MARHIEDQIDYYYDSHSTEEDLMGETVAHAALVHYLVEVLSWLFHGLKCAIYENLNVYPSRNKEEYPLAPDITVIKGFEREPAQLEHTGQGKSAECRVRDCFG